MQMGAICLAAVLALAPAGPALAHGTYGEDLLAGSLRHYPAVLGLRILATDRSGAAIALAEGDFGQGLAILLPLANAMGEPVGELTVQCRCSAGQARRVAAHLARRILTAEGLSEPAPFVAGAQTAPAAQAIVEREVDRHPALVTLAMHVARPQGANAIIASSFGRIGKAADKDDAHVIADGAILREVTNGGRRLAVELPQLDAQGRVIGALSTSFIVTAGHDAGKAYAEALAVRDEIARQTPSLAALLAP